MATSRKAAAGSKAWPWTCHRGLVLCYIYALPYPSHQVRALYCVLPDLGQACLLAVRWHILNSSLCDMACVIRASLPPARMFPEKICTWWSHRKLRLGACSLHWNLVAAVRAAVAMASSG